MEREPYGRTYVTRTGAERRQPLSFPGQEEGVESEVAYNVYRWYRGGWRRYTQADPVGLDTGLNLFAYVKANPAVVADPLGLIGIKYYGLPNKQVQTDCKSASALGCTYFEYDEPPQCKCGPACDLKSKGTVWVAHPKFAADIRVIYSTDCFSAQQIITEEQKHVKAWQTAMSQIDALSAELKAKKFASESACASACFTWEKAAYKSLTAALTKNSLIEWTHPGKKCDGSFDPPRPW